MMPEVTTPQTKEQTQSPAPPRAPGPGPQGRRNGGKKKMIKRLIALGVAEPDLACGICSGTTKVSARP